MSPAASSLALVALGLGLWVSPLTNAFSTTLAAAPTLLGLALWALTGRAFGPPPQRWSSLTLGLAALVAAGAVVGSLLLGLGGAVDSYAHQRQTASPHLSVVWQNALIYWAAGAFLGAAFGFVFGAGATLGVRPTGAALAAPSAKKPVAVYPPPVDPVDPVDRSARRRPWEPPLCWAYATAGATAAWLLLWEITYDVEEQFASTGLIDTYSFFFEQRISPMVGRPPSPHASVSNMLT